MFCGNVDHHRLLDGNGIDWIRLDWSIISISARMRESGTSTATGYEQMKK